MTSRPKARNGRKSAASVPSPVLYHSCRFCCLAALLPPDQPCLYTRARGKRVPGRFLVTATSRVHLGVPIGLAHVGGRGGQGPIVTKLVGTWQAGVRDPHPSAQERQDLI